MKNINPSMVNIKNLTTQGENIPLITMTEHCSVLYKQNKRKQRNGLSTLTTILCMIELTFFKRKRLLKEQPTDL